VREPRRAVVCATAAAAVLGATAASAPATTERAAAVYSLGATSRCLAAHGAKVGVVRPRDTRLRQLHDLAQKTSIEADFKSGRVGIAFSKSESDARLLLELLVVPKDPYRVVAKANAVLMYKPLHRKAYAVALACLRPAA